MQYGFVLPGGSIHEIAELAKQAEVAGWNGVFIPDCIAIDQLDDPASLGFDPWIALAAIALHTQQIRIGTMITPVSRRRPWKLARETTSLDHLSHGRMVLPVGLGALDDVGFGRVGEATERKVRAQLLDEGLAILDRLWSGQRFSYDGTHYHVQDIQFLPTPVQQPRIPVWIVAAWPRMKSMQRAFHWDGVMPMKMENSGTMSSMAPDDIRAMKEYLLAQRANQPIDIIIEGETPGDDLSTAIAHLQPYADAGVTWWLETMWGARTGYDGSDGVRKRILQGPPENRS